MYQYSSNRVRGQPTLCCGWLWHLSGTGSFPRLSGAYFFVFFSAFSLSLGCAELLVLLAGALPRESSVRWVFVLSGRVLSLDSCGLGGTRRRGCCSRSYRGFSRSGRQTRTMGVAGRLERNSMPRHRACAYTDSCTENRVLQNSDVPNGCDS
eukprot:5301419-Prymnesium_polylepis.1